MDLLACAAGGVVTAILQAQKASLGPPKPAPGGLPNCTGHSTGCPPAQLRIAPFALFPLQEHPCAPVLACMPVCLYDPQWHQTPREQLFPSCLIGRTSFYRANVPLEAFERAAASLRLAERAGTRHGTGTVETAALPILCTAHSRDPRRRFALCLFLTDEKKNTDLPPPQPSET